MIFVMDDTQYLVTPSPLVLDNAERKYVLTVHDLPLDERPRERLIAEGPASLSTTELMAVLLNVGTTKEDVLGMARRIMQDYGERGVMSQTSAERLSKDLDIPLGKASQIVAAGELGRRFFERNGSGAPTIRTAREVYEHVADMRSLSKEHLRGLYLNAHYKVIHDEVISIGTVDANIVHPREVFRPALEYSAAAVILVHNHPSGVTDPSSADLQVTEQLVAAGNQLGIPLVDHVIVTKEGFASVPIRYQV